MVVYIIYTTIIFFMKELIKYIKNHQRCNYSELYKDITQEVKDILIKYNLTLYELCYRIKNSIQLDMVFTCKYCGKKIKLNQQDKYFKKFCNCKCANSYRNKSKDFKNSRKNTWLKKYNTLHPMQLEITKSKVKQTCIDKYGVSSYTKTQEYKDFVKEHKDEMQENKKQTCLNTYGVAHYSKTQEYKDKVKQTCLEKYGVSSYTKTQEYQDKKKQTNLKKYGVVDYNVLQECKDKVKSTNIKKYGTNYYTQTQECKDKYKKTCLEKYGVDNYAKTKEFQDRQYEIEEKKHNTIFTKYNGKHFMATDEIQEKIYNTKKQNSSFYKSKQEEECYKLLLTKFKQEDIIRQYRSKEYPFNCDFYIKSLDLYIEYNGSWTHGPSSYDSNNKEHQELLIKWKGKSKEINFTGKSKDYFKNAIYTWTILDVKKLKAFKDNKLNYKIFWNIEEVKEWLN